MRKSVKKKSKAENIEPVKLWKLFQLFVVSSFAAVFAFTLVWFLTNWSALYFAYDFNIPGHFNLSGLFFDADKTSPLWTFDATVTILLSRPVAALLIAVLSLGAFVFIKRKLISFFFFLFWMNVLSFNIALGGLVDDAIVGSGTYDVLMLLKLNLTVVVFSSLVIIYFLYRVGIINFYVIAASFPERYFVNPQGRFIFLMMAVVLPWLLLFTFPSFDNSTGYTLLGLLKNMSVMVILLPAFFLKPAKGQMAHLEIIQMPQKFDWLSLVLFATGTFLLYYFMVDGVYLYA